jgi:hypothetical protein
MLALSQPYISRQAARDWRMIESLQIVIKQMKNCAISEGTHVTRRFSLHAKVWEIWEEKWPWTEAMRLWTSCLPRDLCHRDRISDLISIFAFSRELCLFDTMMVKKCLKVAVVILTPDFTIIVKYNKAREMEISDSCAKFRTASRGSADREWGSEEWAGSPVTDDCCSDSFSWIKRRWIDGNDYRRYTLIGW